jgi:hypothetical protein
LNLIIYDEYVWEILTETTDGQVEASTAVVATDHLAADADLTDETMVLDQCIQQSAASVAPIVKCHSARPARDQFFAATVLANSKKMATVDDQTASKTQAKTRNILTVAKCTTLCAANVASRAKSPSDQNQASQPSAKIVTKKAAVKM